MGNHGSKRNPQKSIWQSKPMSIALCLAAILGNPHQAWADSREDLLRDLQQLQQQSDRLQQLNTELSQELQRILEQADAFAAQGNYTQALALYQQRSQMLESSLGPNDPAVMESLDRLASLHSEQGDYAEAISLYERVLRTRQANLGPKHPDVASSLNNLANVYVEQGNYSQALPLYAQALTIFETSQGPNHPDVANTLSNQAVVFNNQGNFPQAIALHQRALQIRESAYGPTHPLVAVSLNNLGIAYGDQGNYAQAIALHQRALQIRQESLDPNHPDIANSLNNLASIYWKQGNYAAAIPLLQQAETIWEQAYGQNHPVVATGLSNLAQVYTNQGNFAQALPLYRQALDIEERNLSHNLMVGSESYKRDYLQTFVLSTNRIITFQYQQNNQNPAATELALTTVLRRKGRLLDLLSDSTSRLRRNLSPAEAQVLDQLSQLRTQIATLTFQPNPPADLQARLQRLQTEATGLETQLNNRSANFRQVTEPVALAAVQAKIPRDAALIEFVRYTAHSQTANQQERYGVYVVRPSGQPQWIDLGLAPGLDAKIRQTRQVLADARLPIAAVKKTVRELDLQLMAPVRSQAGNATHLLIAPDSELNLLPFAALVDENNKFLIETYLITYLTSGRDLLRTPSSTPAARPTIFANIAYDQPGSPSPTLVASAALPVRSADYDRGRLVFSALPATAEEASGLKSILPQAQLFTANAATETQVKQVESPLVLHLATHGFFLQSETPTPPSQSRFDLNPQNLLPSENPLLRSGLVFAGANVRRSGQDDGVLTGLEVSAMALQGTELVVLSACQTGLGDVATGDGVYGLRRAFSLAGAQSQLGTLWFVNDAATRDLMLNFYRQLQQGTPRGQALRQVQLAMLQTEGHQESGFSHPYYWAPFIPIGDWQAISLTNP